MERRRGDGAQAGERRRGDSGDAGERGGAAEVPMQGREEARRLHAGGDMERRPVEPQRVAGERRMCGSPGGAAAGRRRGGVRDVLSEKSPGVPTP